MQHVGGKIFSAFSKKLTCFKSTSSYLEGANGVKKTKLGGRERDLNSESEKLCFGKAVPYVSCHKAKGGLNLNSISSISIEKTCSAYLPPYST